MKLLYLTAKEKCRNLTGLPVWAKSGLPGFWDSCLGIDLLGLPQENSWKMDFRFCRVSPTKPNRSPVLGEVKVSRVLEIFYGDRPVRFTSKKINWCFVFRGNKKIPTHPLHFQSQFVIPLCSLVLFSLPI